MRNSSKFWVLATALGLGLITLPVAWAYIPPSGFILKSILGKRASVKGLRIRSTVNAMEGSRVTEISFKQVMVYDAQSRTLKSHAYDLNGHELYSIERKLPEVFTAQNARAGEALPTVSSLLFDSHLESTAAVLRAAGIPIRTDAELLQMKDEDERRASEIQSLARLRNQVAWVMGPGTKDLLWPQLWVEKDGFLPLRMIMKGEEGPTDLRFEAYRFQGAYAYPGAITAWKASKLDTDARQGVLREELIELSTTPDPKELRASTSHGYTEAGNAADGATRDLIRRYYSIVR